MHATLPHCHIHTFDHTMGKQNFTVPHHVTFHHWGIGARDEWLNRSAGRGVFTLASIRYMLGHENVPIELLKMDIEGVMRRRPPNSHVRLRRPGGHQLLLPRPRCCC